MVCVTIGLVALRPRRTRRSRAPLSHRRHRQLLAGQPPGGRRCVGHTVLRQRRGSARPGRLTGIDALVVLGAGKRDYTVDRVTISLPDMQTTLNALSGSALQSSTGRTARDRLWRRHHGEGAPCRWQASARANCCGRRCSQPACLMNASCSNRSPRPPRSRRALRCRFCANTAGRRSCSSPRRCNCRVRCPCSGPGTIDVVPAAAPFRSESATVRAWLPSGGALNVTQRAGYDYLGGVLRMRGRLGYGR